MGKTSLVFFLKDGTHFLGDVEVSLALGLLVMPYIIGKTVVEMTDADRGINRKRGHLLLGKAHCAGKNRQRSKHCFSHN